MKVKILRFKDGHTAVSSGMHISVNKQTPKDTFEMDIDKKELPGMLNNPNRQKFRMKGIKAVKLTG